MFQQSLSKSKKRLTKFQKAKVELYEKRMEFVENNRDELLQQLAEFQGVSIEEMVQLTAPPLGRTFDEQLFYLWDISIGAKRRKQRLQNVFLDITDD